MIIAGGRRRERQRSVIISVSTPPAGCWEGVSEEITASERHSDRRAPGCWWHSLLNSPLLSRLLLCFLFFLWAHVDRRTHSSASTDPKGAFLAFLSSFCTVSYRVRFSRTRCTFTERLNRSSTNTIKILQSDSWFRSFQKIALCIISSGC